MRRAPWIPRLNVLLLVFVMVLGILIRTFHLSHPGGYSDPSVMKNWGRAVVKVGWTQSYGLRVNNVMRSNYPPVGMAVFGAAAQAYHWSGHDIMEDSYLFTVLIKFPSILADLLVALVIFFIVKRSVSEKAGIGAAALYLLYPTTWLVSSAWGQTDAIYVALAFGGIAALLRNRPMVAGVCMALAFFMKLQAIFFFPVAAVVLLTQRKDVEYFLIGALSVVAAVIVPFFISGTLGEVVDTYRSLVGYYPSLSLYAYNVWWALFGDAARNTSDLKMFSVIATYRTVGLGIVALIYATFSWRLWTVLRRITDLRMRTEAVLAAASVTTLGFFMFSTQMHERYFFPFIASAIPLLFFIVRGRVIIVTLLCSLTLNLLASFPISRSILYFYRIFPELDGFIASINLIFFIQLAWTLWRTSLNPSRPKTSA